MSLQLKMKGRRILKKLQNVVFVSLIVLLILVTGCSSKPPVEVVKEEQQETETTAPIEKQSLMLGSAGSGGYVYMWGASASKIISDYSDRLSITNQITVGSGENIERLMNGDLKLGVASNDNVFKYYNGDGVEPFKELRTLYLTPGSAPHIIVRADSPYQSLYDLKGKRVAIGPKGGGTYVANTEMLDTLGIGEDGLKAQYLSQTESLDALRNGSIDGWIVNGPFPMSAVTEACTMRGGIRFIQQSDEDIKKMVDAFPYLEKVTVPAGMYPNQTEDFFGAGRRYSLLTTEDFPEDLAYDLAKILYENYDEWVSVFEGVDGSTLEAPVIAPFHPGVEKYINEKGLK